jgi:dephospho-CoA kinase
LIVLGLTGSIGMGKSTAAAMLRRLGVPLFDADLAVHRMLGPSGAAVAAVSAEFPGVETPTGGIDRVRLGQRVFAEPPALRRLEAILHPMVIAEEKRFLARSRARREPLVVLDIPLLFETGAERRCDYVAVVSAPTMVQRQRVLRRPGMTEIRLNAILQKQVPDNEKRRRADFVVPTGIGHNPTLRYLRAIVRVLRQSLPRGARVDSRSADRGCGNYQCVKSSSIRKPPA